MNSAVASVAAGFTSKNQKKLCKAISILFLDTGSKFFYRYSGMDTHFCSQLFTPLYIQKINHYEKNLLLKNSTAVVSDSRFSAS